MAILGGSAIITTDNNAKNTTTALLRNMVNYWGTENELFTKWKQFAYCSENMPAYYRRPFMFFKGSGRFSNAKDLFFADGNGRTTRADWRVPDPTNDDPILCSLVLRR